MNQGNEDPAEQEAQPRRKDINKLRYTPSPIFSKRVLNSPKYAEETDYDVDMNYLNFLNQKTL